MSRISLVLAALGVCGCDLEGSKLGGGAEPTETTLDAGPPSAGTKTGTPSETGAGAHTGATGITGTAGGTGATQGSDTGAVPGTDTGTVFPPPPPPPVVVPGPGCAGTPYALIQDAIDAAAPGDVVEVCAGTYLERLTISGKALTLRARDGAALTIIDAGGGGQALEVTGGADLVLEGFTLRNGVTSGRGGDLECDASSVVLRDCVIEDGEADRGGGVSFTGCTGLIEDSTFRDNHAAAIGGGLYLEGTVDLLRNVFEANASDEDAGGAYVLDGFGLVEGNVFRSNTGITDGGGLYVSGGAPSVDGNTFEDNDCDGEGGGLRVKLSEASITSNTFARNHADWRGGGARISHDESVISGNSWVENTTWGTGGALFLFESASSLSFEVFERNEADEGGAVAIMEGWAGPVIEDSVFDGNEADLGAHLYVDLVLQTTELRRVDLLNGEADVSGGAVYAMAGSDLDLGNVVLASNTAAVSGGALALDGATGRIHNAVAIWNDAPDGAGLHVTNGAALEVVNTAFYGNTGGAAVSYVASPAGVEPTFRYDDFYDNASDFAGMGDPVWQNGNVGDPPGFVDAAGGDFTLDPSSDLVDEGDPGISDSDGSRSDIGRFGGPDA